MDGESSETIMDVEEGKMGGHTATNNPLYCCMKSSITVECVRMNENNNIVRLRKLSLALGRLPWNIKVPLQRNGMVAIPKSIS